MTRPVRTGAAALARAVAPVPIPSPALATAASRRHRPPPAVARRRRARLPSAPPRAHPPPPLPTSAGPVLVDFRCVPDICLPMVAPGKGLDEMFMPGDIDLEQMDAEEMGLDQNVST